MKKPLFFLFFFLSLNSHAQNKSVYGIEFGGIRSKSHFASKIRQVHSASILDGFSAGFSLRKTIYNDFSFNSGYSFRIYSPAFQYEEYYIQSGSAYISHNIPLSLDFNKQLYRNKLVGYIKFGNVFSYDPSKKIRNNSSPANETLEVNNSKISFTWENTTNGGIDFFPIVGFGCRYFINENLLIDAGINYNFTITELRKYNCSITKDSGEKHTFSFYDRGDYIHFSFGLHFALIKE